MFRCRNRRIKHENGTQTEQQQSAPERNIDGDAFMGMFNDIVTVQ